MRLVPAAAVLTAALAVSACGGDGGSTASASDDGSLTVAAGFYPYEFVAERVGGDRVQVTNLTKPGGEPHDLELTPQQVGRLAETDLVVYSAGFQPAVDVAVEQQASDRAFDVLSSVELRTAEGGGHDHGHDDEDEHGHEEEGEDEHPEEVAGGADPHVWLDPQRLATIGTALADRLAELDPDGADTYRGNADALRADLEELDTQVQQALADCSVDTLVTSHDAFGYLGDRYGLEVVGIAGLEPSEEPSPADLAEITELVEQRGVTTVYTETLVDPAVAETVAAEAGVQTAVLDPLEGLTDESAGEDYLEVMRANVETLRQGQSCA